MYIGMNVCVHVCILVCTYYVCTYVCVHVCVYVCMCVCMDVLKVGVIHISFQGSLNTTCDCMKVLSQGFTSSPIAIQFPGLYPAGYASLLSALRSKPTCQVPPRFASTPLLSTKHLLVLTAPQNKDPGDRGGLLICSSACCPSVTVARCLVLCQQNG